jgi:hypothetical protein
VAPTTFLAALFVSSIVAEVVEQTIGASWYCFFPRSSEKVVALCHFIGRNGVPFTTATSSHGPRRLDDTLYR